MKAQQASLKVLGNITAALMTGIGLIQTVRHTSAIIETAPMMLQMPKILISYLAGFGCILLLWIATLISGIGIWFRRCWARISGMVVSAALIMITILLIAIDPVWPDPQTTAITMSMVFIFCYLVDAKEVFHDHE